MGYALQNGKPNQPSAINLQGRWLDESSFYGRDARDRNYGKGQDYY
ncbi:type I toxin-antitoxin system SymE family toxin [Lonsdalea iberica]|nr:type I toxin-antitoxin system SymE family toxin [Lonsdalea iberica]